VTYTVCDSCGSCRKSGSFVGNYFPAIDWTMCSTCQGKGYLSDWLDAGVAMPASPNLFDSDYVECGGHDGMHLFTDECLGWLFDPVTAEPYRNRGGEVQE